MSELDSIRSFAKVVEAGGFAAAGRELGLSRSVVSRHVMDLERRLGAQLLRRSTRRVSTTETGAVFYDRAIRVLAAMEEAVAAVTELSTRLTGNLRVNAPMSFGALHLAAIVADFMAQHPDVHVELVLNDRPVDPIEEGFDVTLRIGELVESTSLVSTELTAIRRVLCASPGYLRARGEPRRPTELTEHRCLHYGYQESGNRWRLKGPDGERSHAVNCVMWSNNGEALKAAALADQGIALLPTFVVGDALRSGSLCTVLEHYSAPEISLSLLYPRHRFVSAKVRRFAAMVAARAQAEASAHFAE